MKNKQVFNKLVRDKIPEIIISNGEHPEIKILNDQEFYEKLLEKLLEECNELLTAQNREDKLEEIADIQEVLHAIINYVDSTKEEVENIRISKNAKRGSFTKRILLISTEEE